MTRSRIPPGLYWIAQKSPTKGVDHHAILDTGNRIGHPDVGSMQPIIIHQTPPSITRDLFAGTGTWRLVMKIADEQIAIHRLHAACAMPIYSTLGNNCEHFARYVATGVRESRQVQRVSVLAGVVGVAWMLSQGMN